MLVAELNLEVPHDLAVALEAKVAGFDDAGMHGPDGDFMDPRSFDTEEGVGAESRRLPFALRGEIRVLAQGLQPRMSLRFDPVLLEELPLEGLCLG